jgi:hypothetical protein
VTIRALLILFSLAIVGCNRPSGEECQSLCLRYAELQYWASFDKQAADLPDIERKKLRKQWEKEWKEEVSISDDRGRSVRLRQG